MSHTHRHTHSYIGNRIGFIFIQETQTDFSAFGFPHSGFRAHVRAHLARGVGRALSLGVRVAATPPAPRARDVMLVIYSLYRAP